MVWSCMLKVVWTMLLHSNKSLCRHVCCGHHGNSEGRRGCTGRVQNKAFDLREKSGFRLTDGPVKTINLNFSAFSARHESLLKNISAVRQKINPCCNLSD